jgi:PPOX class probable F420-dependent enzyme
VTKSVSPTAASSPRPAVLAYPVRPDQRRIAASARRTADQPVSGQAGEMGTMNRQDAIDFISVGARTGKLATASLDGKPHVAPVWFVPDGDDLVFTTGEGTVKGCNLRANPRAALTLDVSEYPYDFVVVRGEVSLERNAPDLLSWTTRIAERYVPARLAPSFGSRNAVDAELLCRLRIDRISGFTDIAL